MSRFPSETTSGDEVSLGTCSPAAFAGAAITEVPSEEGGSVERGLSRRWIARSTGGSLDSLVLSQAVGRPGDLIGRLLAARGVDPDRRVAFFKGALTELERPWERSDLTAVANALLTAIRSGQSIAIYGDYDVDGITAASILWHAVRAIDADVRVRTYVPHRMEEGYGLNADAIRSLAAEGVRFIITVDCGITAVAEAEVAASLGVDLVITDHHRMRDDGTLPRAKAIAHPGLPGREHRCAECCGAMVAWKVAWALFDLEAGSPEGHRLPEVYRQRLSSLLSLAALGTVADVMPLVGENRAVVKHGLAGIRKTGIEGINALLSLGDVGKDVDSETVGFRLAPRLNAVGRLGSAEAAVRLLTTASGEECRAIVRELDQLNEERRRTERAIYEQASQLARERGMHHDDRRAIVLWHPEWHAGVVGIVCQRLVEAFGRPTILLQELEGICKGSGRSIHGFSLVEAIRDCGETPLKSGGHDHAAGITLERSRMEIFAEAFISFATSRLRVEDLVPVISIDTEAVFAELDLGAVLEAEQLAPFGRGNPRPAILVRDVEVTAPPRLMGKEGKHLMLRLKQGRGAQERFLKAKWWDAKAHAALLRPGVRLDVVIEPKVDRYLGAEGVEAEIRDARVRTS
ncbi:MAG: single-stranded-DNA-specific exonuclease RecJ [Phycisphaerae bacterium]|jgi:single-stranded-DNA-specific exonuclease|nr:single-stranded-DNA-specific exonuclease RecJ [Phycisphaerae bacterium]